MNARANDSPAAAAELPAEVKALIAKVVKRTRLRKAERADIERELAAHFRDGLASGKSVKQLIEAFGEPKVSARSIRAGAIARRPPLDRALRQARIAIGWSFLAVLGGYIASFSYLWFQPPVISFDPVERIKATLPKVADSDRAWPLYKQGLLALADPRQPPFKALTFKNLSELEGSAVPGDPGWLAQGKALFERRDAVETLVRAAFMPALGYVPSIEPRKEDDDVFGREQWLEDARSGLLGDTAFSIRLTYAALLRHAARFIATDSLMAIDEGEGARFVRDMEAMIRVSHQSEEVTFVISQLIGAEIRNLVSNHIIMALEWRPQALSDDQLKQLLSMLQGLPDKDFSLEVGLENLWIQDLVQRIYTDNGDGDGWFNPVYASPLVREIAKGITSSDGTIPEFQKRLLTIANNLTAPMGAGILASRKESLEHFDSWMKQYEAQSKRPVRLQDCSFDSKMSQELFGSTLFGSKWFLVDVLTPAYSRAVQIRRLGESRSMASQTAIALTLYRREHGDWPATLDEFTTLKELVPTYLHTAPLDPWTGAIVNYEVKDGRVRVWSTSSEPRRPDHFDPLSASEWVNAPKNGTLAKWLWFSSDDKLERWKTQTGTAQQ
jgi:hypothetical protein